MPESTAWRMFAEVYKDLLMHLGDRRYAEMYAGPRGTVAEVDVVEVAHDDEAGTHWGYIRAGRSEPEMVQPRRDFFDMQFEYGPEVEEKRGHGRIVRLAVVEVSGDA